MNNFIGLLLIFVFMGSKLYSQSINTYSSLYNLGANNRHSSENGFSDASGSSSGATLSLGISYSKKNKINYIEAIYSYFKAAKITQYNNNNGFNETIYPHPNTYGVIVGRGKYFNKSKKITLLSSVFLNIMHRSSHIVQISTSVINTNNINNYHKNIMTHETPNQIQLSVGYRFGVNYNVTPRLFLNLSFNFSGEYIKQYGDIKTTNKTYNYQNEETDNYTVLKQIDDHSFHTRLFTTNFTLGYNIWKDRYHR